MVPVWLCSEDDQFRQELEQEIRSHIIAEGYDMAILLSAAEPERLIAGVAQAKTYGIYFLDIVFCGHDVDGFTLARKIREYDADGFIIYVTDEQPERQIFSFHIQALDYIQRYNGEPLYDRIRECLDIAADRIETMDFKREI